MEQHLCFHKKVGVFLVVFWKNWHSKCSWANLSLPTHSEFNGGEKKLEHLKPHLVLKICLHILCNLLLFLSSYSSFSHDFIGDFTTSYRELARGQSQFNVYEVGNSSVCSTFVGSYNPKPSTLSTPVSISDMWHFHPLHPCCTVLHFYDSLLQEILPPQQQESNCWELWNITISYSPQGFLFRAFSGTDFMHISLPWAVINSVLHFFHPQSSFKKLIYYATIITWMLTRRKEAISSSVKCARINSRTTLGFRMIIAISQFFSRDCLLCLLIAYNTTLYANYKHNSFKCLTPEFKLDRRELEMTSEWLLKQNPHSFGCRT